jgi:hypothetical protein
MKTHGHGISGSPTTAAPINLYFLKAPRHIGHPDERHWNVSIGHAVSPDLADWTVVPDWFMFDTGVGSQSRALQQRIGLATSADLHHWSKHPGSPVLETALAAVSVTVRSSLTTHHRRSPNGTDNS